MNEKQSSPNLTKEALICGIVAILFIIVMWFIPLTTNLKVAFIILGIGIFFDVISLFYHVMTIITGRYMSGFPGVSAFFYYLFILCSQFSLVGWNETSLMPIVLYKIVDALVLLIFSMFCNFPMWFQKSREHYK